MTFIGKVLVIVIMAFALLFLGFSTVVFSTSKDWGKTVRAEQAKVDELAKKLKDLQVQSDAAKTKLDDTKGQFDQMAKQLQTQLTALQDEISRNQTEETKVKGQVDAAQETAKTTLQEVEAKRVQINELRVQKAAIEKQAGEFKLHQAELIDRITEVERLLEAATKNNSDLRERVAKRL